MSALVLGLRQARYEMRAFWRNPAAAFFTFVFPLMFLVIFTVIFEGNNFEVPGGLISSATFYVPGIVCLSLVNACYTNIAMAVAIARERGILKRVHGTPLPAISYFIGRILQSVGVALILVSIVLAFGYVFYDVKLPGETMPAFVVALIVGSASLCALGLAASALVPNEDAAPAVVNATILPLLFISNVFFSTQESPTWLKDFASLFPIAHLADALHKSFSPFTTGSGFAWADLAVVALWGIFGVALAVWKFSWEPRR